MRREIFDHKLNIKQWDLGWPTPQFKNRRAQHKRKLFKQTEHQIARAIAKRKLNDELKEVIE